MGRRSTIVLGALVLVLAAAVCFTDADGSSGSVRGGDTVEHVRGHAVLAGGFLHLLEAGAS